MAVAASASVPASPVDEAVDTVVQDPSVAHDAPFAIRSYSGMLSIEKGNR